MDMGVGCYFKGGSSRWFPKVIVYFPAPGVTHIPYAYEQSKWYTANRLDNRVAYEGKLNISRGHNRFISMM